MHTTLLLAAAGSAGTTSRPPANSYCRNHQQTLTIGTTSSRRADYRLLMPVPPLPPVPPTNATRATSDHHRWYHQQPSPTARRRHELQVLDPDSVLAPCWLRVGTVLDEGADSNQMLIAPAGMFQMCVLQLPCWHRVGTVLAPCWHCVGSGGRDGGRRQGRMALTTCGTVVGTTSKR